MKTRITTFLAMAVLSGGILSVNAVPEMPSAEPPSDVEEVTFQQKLGSQVRSDLRFRNSGGEMVQLGELLDEKPAILLMVYYECPMLCTLTLNGLLDTVKELQFDIGHEFNVITVSFDHEETHVLAAGKKGSYLQQYAREGAEQGWHFLVGDQTAINELSETIGFQFKYIEAEDEYAHRSGIVLLTPEGKVSRYFPGVQYDATGVRLGLVEASSNKIGSMVDRLFLLCYHYDPSAGQYSLVVTRIVNIGCGITVFAIVTFLAIMFTRERKHRLTAAAA